MAKIIEQDVTVRFSKLGKNTDADVERFVPEEVLNALTDVIDELAKEVGNGVVAEVITSEKNEDS